MFAQIIVQSRVNKFFKYWNQCLESLLQFININNSNLLPVKWSLSGFNTCLAALKSRLLAYLKLMTISSNWVTMFSESQQSIVTFNLKWNEQWCQYICRSDYCRKRQRSTKLTTGLSFLKIWWMISVDMLIISVERCFQNGLNCVFL